jgi:hypothetical protein
VIIPSKLPSANEFAAMTPEEAEETLVVATTVLPLLVAKAKELRATLAPEWIGVAEAAHTSGMSRFFFYDHWRQLSFCRKIGRSVKINRKGFRQWLDNKRAA